MTNATKRAILRWTHLVLAIPIIGYCYSPFAELPNYAPVVRYISVPILILSGFWMYAGALFGIIAVAVWLAVCQFLGFGVAILSLMVLLIARKIWMVVRARRAKAAA